MKYKIIFCPDLGLEIEVMHGTFGISDLEEMVTSEMQHRMFRGNYDVITDMRHTQFEISAKEMDEWMDMLGSFDAIMKEKKVGLLTNDPNQVVASTLFKHSLEDQRYAPQMQIFSTVGSMLYWMDIDIDADEYERIIEDPESCEKEFMISK